MLIKYSFSLPITLYNRTYSPNKVQGKTLTITLTKGTNDTESAEDLKAIATFVTKSIKGGVVARIDDPIMIDLLQPKSGNTVHNRLNELKFNLKGKTYEIIGNTVPPETKNGYQVLVLGDEYTVTLEGLAEWLLRAFEVMGEYSVTISDGTIEVFLSRSDLNLP